METKIKKADFIGQKFHMLTFLVANSVIKNGRKKSTFICDCGNIAVKDFHNVFYGATKSCGCLAKENGRRSVAMLLMNRDKAPNVKLPGEAAVRAVFNLYRKNSKIRGRTFDLSEEQVKQLIFSNCVYCGTKPSLKTNFPGVNGQIVRNGIDRWDNKKGYTTENCLPCCSGCNYLKKDLDGDEFVGRILNIARHGQFKAKKKKNIA